MGTHNLLMPRSRSFLSPIPYSLILLLAAFFSFLALENARRFHPDEAYYMTSARHAAVNGDWWLLAEPVDKPPLTFYMNALALVCCAIESDASSVLQLDALKGEFAGRFPSLLLSILLVAIVMKLAKTITKSDKAAYIAGILVVLSPLRIVFAATAFTDMPMLCFGVLALLLAARGKGAWAGFCFMLSFAAKPQVIFYLPLMLMIFPSPLNPLSHKGRGEIWRFFVLVLLGAGILWLWDLERMNQGAESIWVLGQARYTPTSITPLADYPRRLAELWGTLQYSFGHGWITAILGIVGLVFSKKRILSLWLLGFVAIHLVLTLNLFDRNLILVLPILAITLTPSPSPKHWRGESWSVISKFPSVSLFLCISALSFFSLQAAWGMLPIGGDDGRHDGIDELAAYLNSKPVATVIYDTWLDWELDYYMGQWTDKRRVFYPNVELLLIDALALNELGSRYFVVPHWIDESAWLSAMRAAGFALSLDREFANFRVWELVPN